MDPYGIDDQPIPEHPADDPRHDPLGEFATEPPRPLPEYVRRSRYVRGRRSTVYTLAMMGAACCLTAPWPFVQMLSWYILPLGYLDWVGWFLLALAVVYLFRNVTSIGLLKYVRDGRVVTATVEQIGVLTGGNRDYPTGRFVAEVNFVNPETGRPQVLSILTPDLYTGFQFAKMESGLVAGDRCAVVYIPGQIERAQILGWLGIHPEIDLLRRKGRPLASPSPLFVAGVVLGVMGIFWLLLGFLFTMGRYLPIDDDGMWVGVTAIVLGCVVFTAIFMFFAWRRQRNAETKLAYPYGLPIMYGLVSGFLTGFTGVMVLNGCFDPSPRQLQPVKIVQTWHQTIEFMLRTYELEFQPYPKGNAEKRTVTVETLSRFQPDSLAVIDVGEGLLGMRWVRNFYPITWNSIPLDQPGVIPGEITFQSPQQPGRIRIIPEVQISEKEFVVPPEVLVPELRTRMVTYLTTNLMATIEKPKQPETP